MDVISGKKQHMIEMVMILLHFVLMNAHPIQDRWIKGGHASQCVYGTNNSFMWGERRKTWRKTSKKGTMSTATQRVHGGRGLLPTSLLLFYGVTNYLMDSFVETFAKCGVLLYLPSRPVGEL